MSEMAVRCPLNELKLANKLRLQAAAVLHFVSLKTETPTSRFRLHYVREGTD
jgi:hypothetical protein